jgi:uncharacterized protein YjiS (DUF1127 family)
MSCTTIEERQTRTRLGSFADVLRSAWRHQERRRQESVAAERLARLDDHLLRDIGIDRDCIGAAVRGERR